MYQMNSQQILIKGLDDDDSEHEENFKAQKTNTLSFEMLFSRDTKHFNSKAYCYN